MSKYTFSALTRPTRVCYESNGAVFNLARRGGEIVLSGPVVLNSGPTTDVYNINEIVLSLLEDEEGRRLLEFEMVIAKGKTATLLNLDFEIRTRAGVTVDLVRGQSTGDLCSGTVAVGQTNYLIGNPLKYADGICITFSGGSTGRRC